MIVSLFSEFSILKFVCVSRILIIFVMVLMLFVCFPNDKHNSPFTLLSNLSRKKKKKKTRSSEREREKHKIMHWIVYFFHSAILFLLKFNKKDKIDNNNNNNGSTSRKENWQPKLSCSTKTKQKIVHWVASSHSYALKWSRL